MELRGKAEERTFRPGVVIGEGRGAAKHAFAQTVGEPFMNQNQNPNQRPGQQQQGGQQQGGQQQQQQPKPGQGGQQGGQQQGGQSR
jgi:hypothetical protein